MSPNLHLEPQLDAYEKLNLPGFAMMIDAPWGTGKTFALRKWLRSRKHLYVSLYGVGNKEDVEKAILLARLALIDNGTTRGVSTLLSAGLDVLASHYKVKNSLDLTKLGQAALPRLMVFDDLERASMSPSELLSVLNKYVEHEGKNVGFVGNQKELRRKSNEYDLVREKVVGRVISIQPDVESALDAFLDSLSSENGKMEAYYVLQENADIIIKVFSAVGNNNLRLLRQAILELARHYSLLPEWVKKHPSGLKHLVGTFIALSLSYHGLEAFGSDDLRQQASMEYTIWIAQGKRGQEPLPHPIDIIEEKCKHLEFVAFDGAVIPANLAVAWIENGYASMEIVEAELKKAYIFMSEHAEEWQTLWYWKKRSAHEVRTALEAVLKQIENEHITNASIILHVAGIMLEFSGVEVHWKSRAEAKDDIINYIIRLERIGKLPVLHPRIVEGLGSWHDSSFGLEYTSRFTDEFGCVSAELRGALERVFWRENSERVESLFEVATTNPTSFADSLSGGTYTNYGSVPILHGIDPAEAAEIIFSGPPEAVNICIESFKERYVRFSRDAVSGNSRAQKEVDWLNDFRAAAVEISNKSDVVTAAQIRFSVGQNLDFQ